MRRDHMPTHDRDLQLALRRHAQAATLISVLLLSPVLGAAGPVGRADRGLASGRSQRVGDAALVWQTMMYEAFEADLPGNNHWALSHTGAGYDWGIVFGTETSPAHGGSHMGYCAGAEQPGNPPLHPDEENYPDNLNAWMVYGPFDLSDACAAQVRLAYWLRNAPGDVFEYCVSTSPDPSSPTWQGVSLSGTTAGYQDGLLDLSQVPAGGPTVSYLGEPAVYLAFVFRSDGAGTDRGTLLDDIFLEKAVAPCETGPNAPRTLSAHAVSASAIQLQWEDTSSDETAFELQLSRDGTTWPPPGQSTILAANQTTYEDPSLSASTKYYYRLRALRGSTPSAYSNLAVATTLPVGGCASCLARRNGVQFVVDGRPFYFAGVNRLDLVRKAGNPSNRPEIDRYLDDVARMGLRVVRTWAFYAQLAESTDIPFDNVLDGGLHYVLDACEQRGLKLIIVFVNGNSKDGDGGMCDYVARAGRAGEPNAFYTDPDCKSRYQRLVRRIILGGGLGPLKDHVGVFAWELAGEPGCRTDCSDARNATCRDALYAWLNEMSMFVKSLDPCHLVSPGTEGYTDYGMNYGEDLALPNVDFGTVHAYEEHPDAWVRILNGITTAADLRKPFVLEEFGSLNPATRASFYESCYQVLLSPPTNPNAPNPCGGSTYWQACEVGPSAQYSVCSPEADDVLREIRDAAASEEALRSPTVCIPSFTPTGAQVVTTLGGGSTATYAAVQGSGRTVATIEPSGSSLPYGWQVATTPPQFFTITTTAQVSGPITVCLHYKENSLTGSESEIRLLHYDSAATPSGWVPVQTTIDANSNLACGQTSSLSPFVLVVPQAAPSQLMALNDVSQSTGVDELVRIPDPATGVGQRVGSLGGGFKRCTALTLLPASSANPRDRLLAVDYDRILELDTSTGRGTLIGALGYSDVDGLAMQPQTGVLFGVTYGTNKLLRINPTTGWGTVIASKVLAGHRLNDLAFHPDGRLFIITDDATPMLYQVNPATGAKIREYKLSGGRSMEALLWSMDGRTLYSTADRSGYKDLCTIDLATKRVTFVRASQHSGFVDLEALTWLVPPTGATAAAKLTPSVDAGIAHLVLHQNVPNPCNPSTRISFELPQSGPVDLSVYDVAGRRLVTLLQGTTSAGPHQVNWNGHDQQGVPVASGIYFYRLLTKEGVLTRRLIMLK